MRQGLLRLTAGDRTIFAPIELDDPRWSESLTLVAAARLLETILRPSILGNDWAARRWEVEELVP